MRFRFLVRLKMTDVQNVKMASNSVQMTVINWTFDVKNPIFFHFVRIYVAIGYLKCLVRYKTHIRVGNLTRDQQSPGQLFHPQLGLISRT